MPSFDPVSINSDIWWPTWPENATGSMPVPWDSALMHWNHIHEFMRTGSRPQSLVCSFPTKITGPVNQSIKIKLSLVSMHTNLACVCQLHGSSSTLHPAAIWKFKELISVPKSHSWKATETWLRPPPPSKPPNQCLTLVSLGLLGHWLSYPAKASLTEPPLGFCACGWLEGRLPSAFKHGSRSPKFVQSL